MKFCKELTVAIIQFFFTSKKEEMRVFLLFLLHLIHNLKACVVRLRLIKYFTSLFTIFHRPSLVRRETLMCPHPVQKFSCMDHATFLRSLSDAIILAIIITSHKCPLRARDCQLA